MDERMSWEKHVESICSCTTLDTKNAIYNGIVQPYFHYCSPLWDNCGIGLKDKLQKFQNRDARVIAGQPMIFDHLIS